jgi:hypothetical protein
LKSGIVIPQTLFFFAQDCFGYSEPFILPFIEYFIQQQQITFFSTAHGIFSKIDHIVGHKANLNNKKKKRKKKERNSQIKTNYIKRKKGERKKKKKHIFLTGEKCWYSLCFVHVTPSYPGY